MKQESEFSKGVEVSFIWKYNNTKGSKILANEKNIRDDITSSLSLEMASSSKTEDKGGGDEVATDETIPGLLQNLIVSVEHAIERVPLDDLAFPCPKCHEYFDLDDLSLEQCSCECNSQPKPVEKRDSCIQTSPMFEIVGSIPHIDSDEDDSGDVTTVDGDVKDVQDKEDGQKGPVSTGTMTRKSRKLIQPKSVEELSDKVILSGVHLPGTTNNNGQSLVLMDGATILKDKLTRQDIARVLLYYATIPDRSEMDKGFCILLIFNNPNSDTNDDNDLFDLLDQSFVLVQKYFKVSYVLGWKPTSSKATAIYQQRYQRSVAFPKSKVQYQVITDEPSLRTYCSVESVPQTCGGKVTHDQLEWVEFFKEFEPFLSLCHGCGRRLVNVMSDLRSFENTQKSRRQVHHQQRSVTRALSDIDLQRLRKDGVEILHRLEERAQWLPSSQHVRSSMEQAKRLFGEVDRAAKRLEYLLERRKQRLRELAKIRALEDETNQVLSWLEKKGEDTLKKHTQLATSLAGIKKQEQEFEKFYFISMRHLDKGSDLVDEATQCIAIEDTTNHSGSGLRDLARTLKQHLRGFGERLEDTRERLEDTSRCFYLLDKAYEWSLETTKYMNRIKIEEVVGEDAAHQLLNNIGQRLQAHPPLSEAHFHEMLLLAKKLENEKLGEQCRVAQGRCHEALEMVQNAEEKLLQAQRLNDNGRASSPVMWNPLTSTPNNTNMGRRRSLGSFPYIYKCSHHAAGHDCSCDSTVTRDPSKQPNYSECQCVCGNNMQRPNNLPLGEIRESAEDLIGEWESRAAAKRNIRRTCTWQYPTEGFEDPDTKSSHSGEDVSNKSSHSGEDSCNNKDLDDHEALNNSSNTVHIPMSVNSHLYCHASNLSLNLNPGEQVKDAKTQKTLLLIMREMIQTERDYVASLEYVIENYIPELLREDIPQALRGQRNVVFGNIEKIYEFHSQHFLQELERCEKNPLHVGQFFLRHENKFYLYALYNKNKPKSDSLMTEYGTSFFKTKQLELGDKMDLASYLLKPVQRMGKYALLLQQLMKACGEKESSDLSSAEAMVRFQLRHGNDLLAMDSLRDCDVNVKEQGRLLRQNEFLVWQGKGKKCLRHVFLFEELILFSKARRFPDRKNLDLYIYKNSIKTTDIGLTAKIGDSPTKFEIWFRKRKPNDTFTLQSMSEEVKQAWIEELSTLLWKQALRNREMRLQEMSSMGIGNKPCLDIRPSADQISDRSISVAQLNKTAPRFRNSIALLSGDFLRTNKRPHSIISVTSSSSSSTGSGSHVADSPHLPRSALHSQCSTESGIIADMSLASEDLETGRTGRWHLERSNSSATSVSLDSSLSPTSSAEDTSGFSSKLYNHEETTEI